jgi:RHS repeat-associated protein
MSLYINGNPDGTANNTKPIASSGAFMMGRAKLNGSTEYFGGGFMADVQVYQRTLSSTDVKTLYANGRTGGTVSSSTRQPTTTWRLDERGLPLSMNDANNNRTYYTYDEAGHLTVTTSPTVSVESNGGTAVSSRAVTTRGYNNFGEQTESQDANGNITTTVYDANGQSVSTTGASYTPPGSSTPIVPVTVRTYNALGQITDVSDPLSHNTHDDFDQLGDLAQTIDANGGVTHSTYDLNGQRLSTTDPTGAQTTATYDYLGRQLTAGTVERFPSSATYTTVNSYAASTKDPGGAWVNSTTSPSGVVTSYGYDALGEQTSATDGGGDTSTFTYDYLGRTTAMGLADGSSTRKSYDESGDTVATSTLDTTGSVLSATSASYDNVGNMLTSTDSRQTVTKFTYDALGNLTKEQQPTAAATATTAALAITTTVGYDAAGNKTRFTDGRGNSWIYTVNSWNMPESEIEPATTTYTTATDRTITTSYDAVGNAVKQVQPGGILLTNGYDPMHQIKTMSGTGAAAATADHGYDYDGDGRLKTATSTAAGAASATSEAFTYNDRGEVLTATGSAANSSFGYNNDGQMNSRTDASGITGYGYDTAGRLASVTDAVTGVQLTYGYNNLNQLKTVNYGATGDKRAYDYDSSHRLRTDTLQTSGSTTIASIVYGYDLNNNLTSKTTTGYGNAATNTYTYDLADRLTSWTAGSTTTGYAYDDSGNRTQVGANVYTYDARDELTGDGNNTYTYTAAGTTATQTTSSGTVKTTSDAYGQAITQGTETYAYDALGRLLTATPNGGTANQLSYSGPSNAVAADNSNKYSRDPDGGLVGIGSTSTTGGVLALTDQHTDVVGDFSATGTALSGSTSYDPLGNVLATISQAGHLGYQSGWTDPATKQVNMAARWYNPGTGQFTSRDTVEQSTSPNSASFNPFAYGADSPMTSVDPSGHGWWSTVKSWGSTAWHGVVSAWHVTTHFVSTYIIHPIAVVYHAAYNAAAKQIAAWHRQSQRLWDNFVKQYQAMQARLAQNAHIRALNAAIKRKWAAASHVVRTAYHYTAKAVTATKTFVQHHAAAIGSFVVSTAVFMGCEAVLGVATGGAGAVVGAVACGALAGAVGGLFDQGAKCVDGQKGACSAASFARSAVVGGVVGGLSGLGGAVGGKVLRSVGGKALGAVGGIFGRGSTEVGEGLAEGTAVDAASSTADTAAETMGESGANDVAEAAAPHGGEVPRGEDPSVSEPTERPSAGDEEEGSPSCTVPVHSFTGSTKVLTADGGGKPIDQIKVGDKVRDAVPGGSKDETHTVQAVIVTTTDHDFVDLTVAPKKSDGTGGKTALKVATGLLAAAATLVPAQGGTLTTTFHHPFYDRTRAAFVEAKDLKVGDELQTPDGGTTTVTALRLYHTNAVTYDLTIDGLHTYYVAAGDTPILVHNCGKKTPRVAEARQQAGAALRNANWHPRTFDLGGGRSLTLTRERMVHIMTRHMQEFFTGKPTTDQSFFPAGTTIDDVTSLVGKAISGNRPQLRALLESGGGQMDARIDGQDYQMGVGGMRDIIGQFFPK